MILDSLNNAHLYAAISEPVARAFAYLAEVDLKRLSPGRYEIDGEQLFMSVVESDLRPAEQAPLEVHDRYIDIQILIQGEEQFGWRDRKSLTQPTAPFDAERDIQFFEDAPQTFYALRPGQFTLLMPEDAHAPLVGSGSVRKAIVKVRCC